LLPDFDKLIINVAVTGMVHRKADVPALPITPDEIAEDCYQCYQLGASIFHLHARDQDGEPTYKAEVYREIISKVRKLCPDAILCVSTSGRVVKTLSERSEVLELDGDEKPDMASLTLGSFNFPQHASINEPAMIQSLAEKMYDQGIVPELEIFDFGMVDYAKYLIKKNILQKKLYFNMLLGSLCSLSATPFNMSTLAHSLPPDANWGAAGIGRFQFYVNSMAITMGGHIRVGLEDNIYYDCKKREITTNLELVKRIVKVAKACEREIATPSEARQIIGLEQVACV